MTLFIKDGDINDIKIFKATNAASPKRVYYQ